MKRILGIALLLLSAQSNAGIVGLLEYDYLSQGDNLITVDTGTGLQWLDVSYTAGESMLSIESGGLMDDGWKWATESQIRGLFEYSHDWTDGNRFPSSVNVDLINLLGPTLSRTEVGDYTRLLISGTSRELENRFNRGEYHQALIRGFEKYNGYNLPISDCDDLMQCTQIREGGFSETNAYFNSGFWLVRSVPEPSVTALLGFGVLSLCAFRRKRREL